MFSGHIDTDSLILEKLDDRDLLNFCHSYKSKICSNDKFWKNRLIKRYPEAYKYFNDNSLLSNLRGYYPTIIEHFIPSNEKTWKQYYLHTIYYINKMKEIYDFTYKTGDPKNYYAVLFGNKFPHVQMEVAGKLGYIDLLDYFLTKGNYNYNKNFIFFGAAQTNQIDVIKHFLSIMDVASSKMGLIAAKSTNNLKLIDFFERWYNYFKNN